MLKIKNLSKALLCIVLLSFGKIASAQKVGFVSYDSLLYLLPQYETISKKFDSARTYYGEQLEGQKADLEVAAMKLDSIKTRISPREYELRMSALQQTNQRIQSLSELYKEELSKYQESLVRPLNVKVRKAIEEVAKANGFSSVVDKQVAYYFNPADDLTAIVMKKLNIVIPPPMPAGMGNGQSPPGR